MYTEKKIKRGNNMVKRDTLTPKEESVLITVYKNEKKQYTKQRTLPKGSYEDGKKRIISKDENGNVFMYYTIEKVNK